MGGLELQRLSGHTAEQAETHNIDLPKRWGACLDQPRYSIDGPTDVLHQALDGRTWMNSSLLYTLSAQMTLPICCGLHPRFHHSAIAHIHRPPGRRDALLREGRHRGADRRGIPAQRST
jgi:hypothetical protein